MPFRALLASIFGFITKLRNRAYDRKLLSIYRSSLPVICVGNLTVGGNGKTPLVLWLAQELISRGERPVILSRGYGGRNSGPHQVFAEKDTVAEVGDEPLMMARRGIAPVVIARKRVDGAKLIEAGKLGTVIILDDGFQHRALDRDVNLLCVAAADSQQVERFLAEAMLPQGLYREPFSDALARTDAIIWQSRNPHPPAPIPSDSRLGGIPIFTTSSIGEISGTIDECVLVTAIANPEQVAASVSGVRILEHRKLSDHSLELEAEIAQVSTEFPGISVVVTEKDAVKLKGEISGVLELSQRVLVSEPQRLVDLVMVAIDSKRNG